MNLQEATLNLLGIRVPESAYYTLFCAGDFVLYKARHSSGAFSVVRFVYREGEYVQFPSHYFFKKEVRNQHILNLHNLGIARNDIADIMRCTAPTIYNALKGLSCQTTKMETH